MFQSDFEESLELVLEHVTLSDEFLTELFIFDREMIRRTHFSQCSKFFYIRCLNFILIHIRSYFESFWAYKKTFCKFSAFAKLYMIRTVDACYIYLCDSFEIYIFARFICTFSSTNNWLQPLRLIYIGICFNPSNTSLRMLYILLYYYTL